MANKKIDATPFPKDNQIAVLEALKAYKKQNPAKYEQKKAALFKQYGLDLTDEPAELQDEADKELEELAEKVAAKKTAKKAANKVTKKAE